MHGEPGRYRFRAAAVCPLPFRAAKLPPMLPPRPVPSHLPPHCLLLPLSAAACDLRRDAEGGESARPLVARRACRPQVFQVSDSLATVS